MKCALFISKCSPTKKAFTKKVMHSNVTEKDRCDHGGIRSRSCTFAIAGSRHVLDGHVGLALQRKTADLSSMNIT